MDTAACCPFLRSWSAERRQRQAAGSCRFSAITERAGHHGRVREPMRRSRHALHDRDSPHLNIGPPRVRRRHRAGERTRHEPLRRRRRQHNGSSLHRSCASVRPGARNRHGRGGGRRRHGTAGPLRRPVFAVGRPSDDDPRAGRRAASDAHSRRLGRRTERRPARAPLPRSRPFQCAHVLRTWCRGAADRGRRQRNLHALRHARVP